MSRFSSAFRSAGAGSTTLPIGGLTATAASRPYVVEVGVFNTTTTAVAMALRRITALGTPGAGQVEVYEDDDVQVPLATTLTTWTVAPTFVSGNLRTIGIGTAIGAGVIWTFGQRGLMIPPGTANGIVLVPLSGTGQICDVYFVWDE